MMKHLKRIDELYKSTYMSAARKLRDNHPKRAEELEIYGKLKGKNKKIDRIFPYKFYLANHWSKNDILKKYIQVNEYLFITNIDKFNFRKGGFSNEFDIFSCDILFESNYNSIFKFNIRFVVFNDEDLSQGEKDKLKNSKTTSFGIEIVRIEDINGIKDNRDHCKDIGRMINLRNRKDAMNLKKSILESIDDKKMEKEYNFVKDFPLNMMYVEG